MTATATKIENYLQCQKQSKWKIFQTLILLKLIEGMGIFDFLLVIFIHNEMNFDFNIIGKVLSKGVSILQVIKVRKVVIFVNHSLFYAMTKIDATTNMTMTV